MSDETKSEQIAFSMEKALAQLNEKINKLENESKPKSNYLSDAREIVEESPYLKDGTKLLESLGKPTNFEELAKLIREIDTNQPIDRIVKILKIAFDSKDFSDLEYRNFLTRYSPSKELAPSWNNCKKFFTNGEPFVWFYPSLRRDTATTLLRSGEKIFLIRHSGTYNNFFVASYINAYSQEVKHYLIGINQSNNFYLSGFYGEFFNPEQLLLRHFKSEMANGRDDDAISNYCRMPRIN